MGYTPSRDEFLKDLKIGSQCIVRHFGSYSQLIEASGLDAVVLNKKKKQDVFTRDLVNVLVSHQPQISIAQPVYLKTLCIGDTHFPFINMRVLEKIYRFAEEHRPQRIIQMGDLFDCYAHTKFPRSLNIYTPDQEEDLAVQGAADMWRILQEICPKAECIQLKGNHDIRASKRILEASPSSERAVSYWLNHIMTFDGVKLIEDSRQEFIDGDVQYIHGYRSGLGSHRDFAMMNTVCAHTHKGGTVFRRFRGQTFWELNAGFVGDAESKALGYTPQKIYDSTTGVGWLDEHGPRFIPIG